MRRKHGVRESSGGMLNQRGERDAAISTAERKWGCQDKDKLRQREKKIRGRLDISKNDGGERENKLKDGKKATEKNGRQSERERGQGSVFGVPARRKCQWP